MPKMATAPRPDDTTPINHGRQMTAATRVEPRAKPTACRVERQSPKTREERRRPAATSTTATAAAGANETRTASTRPSVTTLRSLPWRTVHSVYRRNADDDDACAKGTPAANAGCAGRTGMA